MAEPRAAGSGAPAPSVGRPGGTGPSIGPGGAEPVRLGRGGSAQLKVMRAGADGIEVELVVPGMTLTPAGHVGSPYQRVSIPGAGAIAGAGRPELPAVARFFAMPRGADARLEILEAETALVEPAVPFPVQPPSTDAPAGGSGTASPAELIVDRGIYEAAEPFPLTLAELEPPRLIRGCPVAGLKLFPVRFEPAQGQIVLYSRLRVRITFSGGEGVFIEQRHRAPAFERLFRSLLLNPDVLGPAPWETGGSAGAAIPECELLIITHPAFEAAARRLAEWKILKGIPTQVVTTEAIWETYERSADGIDAYIEDQYAAPNAPWPEMSHVLLFGDTMEGGAGGAEGVPCHYSGHPDIDVGTDLYYGVIGGGGHLDYFPELLLGRISVDLPSQADTVVDKIIGYEREPALGDPGWLKRILLAAWEDDMHEQYYIETSEALFSYLDGAGYDCNRQYEDGHPSGSWPGVRDAINGGVFLVTHRDHGIDRNYGDEASGWLHPPFTDEKFDELTNGELLPVVLSVNCNSGWFDGETDGNPDCGAESFCEELLKLDGAGAVGVIGDTRFSYGGYNDELIKGFIDAVWPEFDPLYPNAATVNQMGHSSEHGYGIPLYDLGSMLLFGKLWMYDRFVISEGAGYPPDWAPTDLLTIIQFEVCHCFGDPTMEIRTGPPDIAHPMTVSHDMVTFLGEESFPVAVANGEGALISLVQFDDLTGEPRILGRATVTDQTPTEVFFEEPLSQPEMMHVTVTLHNAEPYHGMVFVGSPEGPYMRYDSHAIDDGDIPPAAGNDDGMVSPGERVSLELTMHNVGQEMAEGITVTLFVAEPHAADVVMVPGYASSVYGDIDFGRTAVNPTPLVFDVRSSCPDGATVWFDILAEDSTGQHWASRFFITVHGSDLRYYSHQVLDESCGNGDFIADPGEAVLLRTSIRNHGTSYATGVWAEISLADPGSHGPYVTITDAEADFPIAAPGHVVTSMSDHFTIEIDQTTPCGTLIAFNLDIHSNEGPSLETFEALVGAVGPLFTDNMESGPGDWSHGADQGTDTWEIVDTALAHSGNFAWHGFNDPPATIQDNSLRTPTVGLTDGSGLTFWHYYDFDENFDGAVLELSTDGGVSWLNLGPNIVQGGYTAGISDEYGNPLCLGDNAKAWTGTNSPTSPEPRKVVVDLSDFDGSDASVRFRMGFDSTNPSAAGTWAIDDVTFTGVDCTLYTTPVETVFVDLVCTPAVDTLPFTIELRVFLNNVSGFSRRIQAAVDLQLAGGYYMAMIANQPLNIPAGPSDVAITRNLPYHPLLAGINHFRIRTTDITPPPYNQPPYVPSGFTDTDTCVVECLVP